MCPNKDQNLDTSISGSSPTSYETHRCRIEHAQTTILKTSPHATGLRTASALNVRCTAQLWWQHWRIPFKAEVHTFPSEIQWNIRKQKLETIIEKPNTNLVLERKRMRSVQASESCKCFSFFFQALLTCHIKKSMQTARMFESCELYKVNLPKCLVAKMDMRSSRGTNWRANWPLSMLIIWLVFAPFCSPHLCWGRRCGRRWCSACACSVVAMTWWPLSSWWMESRLAIFLDHLWTSDPNLSSPWSRGRIRIKYDQMTFLGCPNVWSTRGQTCGCIPSTPAHCASKSK